MNPPKISIVLSLFVLLLQICTSIDTISSNLTIKDSDGDVLISNGQTFAFGFFSAGNTTSTRRYVGIWYHKVSKRTYVWVANRDNPVNGTSGVLSINNHGNFILYAGNQTIPVWSTNVSVPSNGSSKVQLMDSGNLVLLHQESNKVLWQSFDYPSDTLIPYMKLGLDRRTGLNRIFSSWKSENDPGTSNITLQINTSGFPQLFLYNDSVPLWRIGPWTGIIWSAVSAIIKFSFVNNRDELFLTYSMINASIISRITVDFSGTLSRSSWNDRDRRWITAWSGPREECDLYGHCGPNSNCDPGVVGTCKCLPGFEPRSTLDWYLSDGSSGCIRKSGVSICDSGEGFVKMIQVKVPDTTLAHADLNMNLKACRQECQLNCSCSAYTSADMNGTGCLMWYGDLIDTRTSEIGGNDIYIRVDAATLAANATKDGTHNGRFRSKTFVSISVPVILAVFISALCIISFWWRKHSEKKGHREKQKKQEMLFLDSSCNSPDQSGGSSKTPHHHKAGNVDVTFFELSTITAATNNFADKLGQGGFGSVYKGQLQNGQEIAVKRLSTRSGQGVLEFKNEVLLIAKLQHRNLVRLLGCCLEDEEKMLIYEFMPNKSLDYFIFDESRKLTVDWKMRFEIIIGISRGILYLHQDSRLRIIHRDLKTSNILLDADMNPKISDFGTARIFGDEDQANTRRVVGTFGYMSPEYVLAGRFSTKSDVFSFGVLMLEIISGKKSVGCFQDEPSSSLIRHAWELWRDDKPLALVDSFMVDSCPGPEIVRCIQVGLLCVQDRASDRPTMSSIIFMLSNDAKIPFPKEPTFTIRRFQNNQPESSSSGTKSSSINEVTITVLDAR